MNLEDRGLEPATILFIEDSPLDAEIVFRNLKRAKLANPLYHVRDGSTALDYLMRRGMYQDARRFPLPDLILLDLNLPRISGWEVLQTIRRDDRLRDIPVVVMTSSRQDEDLVQSQQGGYNTFVPKPVDFAKIVEVVQSSGRFQFVLSRIPAGAP